MVNTISMQDIRYLNLFGKITKVQTRFCFAYNNMIFFCVPKKLVSRALGSGAQNIRKIGNIINKRVRIIPTPNGDGVGDMKKFIEIIVDPVEFKDIELKGNEVILTAGSQSKAALLGRNKRRLLEMQKIVGSFFNKEFRIV